MSGKAKTEKAPDFKLERSGDEPGAADAKFVAPKVEADPYAPTQDKDAVEELKAENESLRSFINSEMAEMRASLAQLQGENAPKAAIPGAPVLDKTRDDFKKHRTAGGGVTYEQGGYMFDARGRLMANQE